jgi:hypothetical protein
MEDNEQAEVERCVDSPSIALRACVECTLYICLVPILFLKKLFYGKKKPHAKTQPRSAEARKLQALEEKARQEVYAEQVARQERMRQSEIERREAKQRHIAGTVGTVIGTWLLRFCLFFFELIILY